MVLRSTQPLTEMSTRNISRGLRRPVHRADFHVPIVLKSGSLNLLEPSGPLQACSGIAFTVKMTTLPCLETSATRYPVTRRHFPLGRLSLNVDYSLFSRQIIKNVESTQVCLILCR